MVFTKLVFIIKKGGIMSKVDSIRSKRDIKNFEQKLLLKNYRDYVLFCLGINSGLRISDILALNIKDVKNKNYIDIIEKKTKKHKRFPINEKLKKIFQKYTKGKKETSPLFTTKYNNRLDRICAYRILNEIGKQTNLEINIGTHTLRKTFGYHHYKQFKDIAMLQKIFNHSSPDITLRYIGMEQEEIENSYLQFVL